MDCRKRKREEDNDGSAPSKLQHSEHVETDHKELRLVVPKETAGRTLDSLPTDCLISILSRLSTVEQLWMVRGVCRFWRSLVEAKGAGELHGKLLWKDVEFGGDSNSKPSSWACSRHGVAPVIWVAASCGNAQARRFLGYFHFKGLGVERNLQRANEWWSLAASQNDIPSIRNLGFLHGGICPVWTDHDKAIELYRKAAHLGDGRAYYNLAVVYAWGIGTPSDSKVSVQYLREGANRGDKSSRFWLARRYLSGSGVPKDVGHGQQLFGELIEDGYVPAMIEYGRWLLNESRDMAPKAVELFSRAASRQSGVALACLSMTYELGIGNSLDLQRAYDLLANACLDQKFLSRPENMHYASARSFRLKQKAAGSGVDIVEQDHMKKIEESARVAGPVPF